MRVFDGPFRELVALNAIQFLAETGRYPRRVMAHVLAMSALEFCHPVICKVRVKAGDFSVHSPNE